MLEILSKGKKQVVSRTLPCNHYPLPLLPTLRHKSLRHVVAYPFLLDPVCSDTCSPAVSKVPSIPHEVASAEATIVCNHHTQDLIDPCYHCGDPCPCFCFGLVCHGDCGSELDVSPAPDSLGKYFWSLWGQETFWKGGLSPLCST
jgi:hypothetical protein